MRPPLVEVLWHDACLRSGGASMSAVKTDAVRQRFTVGFLAHEDEDKVVVAATFDPHEPSDGEVEDEVDGRWTIKKSWIEALRYIERGPKKRNRRPKPATRRRKKT